MANGICIFAENYNGKLEPARRTCLRSASDSGNDKGRDQRPGCGGKL